MPDPIARPSGTHAAPYSLRAENLAEFVTSCRTNLAGYEPKHAVNEQVSA